MTGSPDPLQAHGERYRELRQQIEEAIHPQATSVDGRHFTCQVSARDLALQVGGHVIIEHEGKIRLGQLLDLGLELVDGPEIGIGVGRVSSATVTRLPFTTVSCVRQSPRRSTRGSSTFVQHVQSSRSASSGSHPVHPSASTAEA